MDERSYKKSRSLISSNIITMPNVDDIRVNNVI